MPKKAAELGPLAVSRLTAPGMHFVGGVAGLALQVLPSGGRSWVLRATIGGDRRDMGLGGFPDVTLAAAREAARKAREKIRAGIDPIEEAKAARNLLKLAKANAIDFEQAAKTYIAIHEPGWHNAKHAQQWRNTLATYAYPVIGKVIARDLDTHHVLSVLEPIWRTKTETASRVRSRIESVIDWATTKKYRDGPNPARWKGHLDNLLPAPSKITKERHHPALPVDLMPAFMADLREQQGIGARALEYLILTAVRSQEIRGAMPNEVDRDEAAWEIPGERMKMKRAHRVPLSKAALSVLDQVWSGNKADPIFKATKVGMLSDGTLNAVIRRMDKASGGRWVDPKNGRTVVAHGFRSTFRDWAAEHTNYPREVAEMALAHTIDDKVEAAYRRGDLFEKRRRMMDDWAKFIGTTKRPAKVIDMKSKRA